MHPLLPSFAPVDIPLSGSTLALPRVTPVTWQPRAANFVPMLIDLAYNPFSSSRSAFLPRLPIHLSFSLYFSRSTVDTVNHGGLKSINAFPETARSDLFDQRTTGSASNSIVPSICGRRTDFSFFLLAPLRVWWIYFQRRIQLVWLSYRFSSTFLNEPRTQPADIAVCVSVAGYSFAFLQGQTCTPPATTPVRRVVRYFF